MIDGSGWGETFPGSGVYVHSSNVYADGGCMWNGKWDSWLLFDLGREYHVNGMYVWNYNERGGWSNRGIREMQVLTSLDNRTFARLGVFKLAKAPARDDYEGQTVPFDKPVRARYVKFQTKSNYRGGEMSGLAEVRFSNTLGEMEVGILLDEHLGAGSFEMARGWDGDRFALVDGGGREDGLVWVSVWDDASSRSGFVRALRPALGSLPFPATLEEVEVEGRPGAMLTVGVVGEVRVTVLDGAAR